MSSPPATTSVGAVIRSSRPEGDPAAAREAGDVGVGDVEGPQEGGGVVGHQLHRKRSLGQRRAAGSAVVEGREPVAVGQPVELGLPGLGRVAEPGDEQDVGALAPSLDPQVHVADVDGPADVLGG